jgi:hypothetical protein
MRTHYSSISCGVHQIHDFYNEDEEEGYLTSKKKLLDAFERLVLEDYSAFIMFSDTQGDLENDTRPSNGEKLAAALEKKYPGSLTTVGPAVNPNSGNPIMVWVFAIPASLQRTKVDDDYPEYNNDDDEWA